MKIKSLIKNKVVFYLVSRYATYAIQFVTSLFIAAELGPYYMGIWGFLLLILQYFQQFHLGIANSFNVLYVHHRNNQKECNSYIVNSLLLVGYLSLLVVVVYLYYKVVGIDTFEKYHADRYILFVCIIAILQYFVQFFINLFRVKNQLNRVTFCQSVIIFLNFACIFFFRGEELIRWLIAGYLVGNLSCLLLAFTPGHISNYKGASINLRYQKEIIKKGLYLFLYNSCFYFIIISIRTIISTNYNVEDFGIFTFSFSLAHAILLLLEAVSFVIFPKVIGKLSSLDNDGVLGTITTLRTVYNTSAHLLVYMALICFPLLLYFFPKYESALTALNLISLTILMNTNSYGYTDLLISRNREKLCSVISIVALILNCLMAIVFVYIFKFEYSYVILATLITYVFFTLSAHVFARMLLKQNILFSEWFPLRLFLPYSAAFFFSIVQKHEFLILSLLLFLLMNRRQLLLIKDTTKLLLESPEKVNL